MSKGIFIDKSYEQNAVASRIFSKCIAREMFPFRPGRVWISEETYSHDHVISYLVEAENLPGVFARVCPDLSLATPIEYAAQLGHQAGRVFANLPKPPITDNIELGEN